MNALLNGWAEGWAGFMWRGIVDATLLLAILLAAWLPVRRRVPAQVGYCLFLLVLVKLLAPVQVPVPGWLAYLSPRYSIESATVWATRPSTQPDLSAADFSMSGTHSPLGRMERGPF